MGTLHSVRHSDLTTVQLLQVDRRCSATRWRQQDAAHWCATASSSELCARQGVLRMGSAVGTSNGPGARNGSRVACLAYHTDKFVISVAQRLYLLFGFKKWQSEQKLDSTYHHSSNIKTYGIRCSNINGCRSDSDPSIDSITT